MKRKQMRQGSFDLVMILYDSNGFYILKLVKSQRMKSKHYSLGDWNCF